MIESAFALHSLFFCHAKVSLADPQTFHTVAWFASAHYDALSPPRGIAAHRSLGHLTHAGAHKCKLKNLSVRTVSPFICKSYRTPIICPEDRGEDLKMSKQTVESNRSEIKLRLRAACRTMYYFREMLNELYLSCYGCRPIRIHVERVEAFLLASLVTGAVWNTAAVC